MTTSVGRRLALLACAAFTALALGACSAQSPSSTANTASSGSANAETSTSATTGSQTAASTTSGSASTETSVASTTSATFGAVANTLAQDEEALVNTYASKFAQKSYTDESTGLSVTYDLFLPEGYDASKSYPMVVFIGDSTCANGDAERSLTQGRGALVWAADEWQAQYPCIVCVPVYPETILDDHNGYSTTEYVELTKRLIESVAGSYAVDSNRIYGTGQSMGCMTTLVLASEYPDLYAACMFVDGQWDVSALKGLEKQKFVYFAAEDDTSAFNGMSEVMAMFDADSVPYANAQWDGSWSCDELSAAAEGLFSSGNAANFVSWKTGTIDTSTASMGGMGGSGGPNGSGGMGGSGSSAAASGNSASAGSQASSGGSGGMGGVAYHMASFDYAYNCVAVMEWLFQQAK